MNYRTVEEMINAGTTNMTVLRNNSDQDDGTDTVTGVDWFTFNGNVATNIYVSGNSFLGFGTSSEQLKVNRRDAKMWYLYREEGVISGTKFLKIRWSGYAYYSSTSASNKLEYDVIIFEGGNIYLHFVTKPTSTSYYNGTFTLTANTTYNYSKDEEDILFEYNQETNSYTVKYEIPSIILKKFLFRVGSEIFTRVGETIQSLGEIELTADIFNSQGADTLFTSDELVTFNFPEVLLWTEDDIGLSLKSTVKAKPIENQQIITDAIELTNETIKGIETVTVDCTGDLLIAVSFDNKETWKAWNGTSWMNLDAQFSGMSKSTLEAIPIEGWSQLYEGATEMFIRISMFEVDQSLKQIYVDFLN